MNNISNAFTLCMRLCFLFLIYTLARILFFLFNFDYFKEIPFQKIVYAFFYGARFDLHAIFAINAVFIFLSLIPFKYLESIRYQQILKVVFISINLPLILLNLVDLEYFKFTGKRTTADVLGIFGDVIDQSAQLFWNFWYVSFIFFLILWALLKYYPKLKSPFKSSASGFSWSQFLILIIGLGFTFAMIRGSWEKRPVSPRKAFEISPAKLGNLVLNSPFSFLYTLQVKGVENLNFYNSWSEVYDVIDYKPYEITQGKNADKDNVVIIILESFGREYMGYRNPYPGYTPFLDSLASVSTFFPYHFANGRTSIESIPSILAGIPSLTNQPFITSIYQNNEVIGLGTVLKDNGYHTSFFHGGKNGTFGLNSFTQAAGFEEYYGMDEYPNSDLDYDKKWGIYDEPYLEYFAKSLSGFKQPFATSVFTLSSHPPYPIPEKYKGVFSKGTLPIHETIGYTDNSLKNFFTIASTMPWYKNTLFVITSDHTQHNEKPLYQNIPGEYNVPLLFFHPNKKIVSDTTQISEHVDIPLSVLNFLQIEPEKFSLAGESLLDNQKNEYAITHINSYYRIIGKDWILEYDPDKKINVLANPFSGRQIGTDESDNIKKAYSGKLKAYIQYYNNGMNENKYFISKKTLQQ